MKHVVCSAIAATLLSAAALGLAGTAGATPLNDPNGLCSYHDDLGNCLYGAAGPSRSVDLRFPSDFPQEQAIVDYLDKAVDEFNADAGPLGTLDDPLPLEQLEATSTRYSSGTPETGTQTVVVELDQTLRHAAHPMNWYQSFSYNNATQATITFNTLFRPGTQPLPAILPIVEQQLSVTAGAPITIDPATGLDPASYQDFAVTDEAVLFFFDKNQIHPAYGATVVSVPRTAIAAMLSPGI